MFTLRQYIATLSDPQGLTRTLGDIAVCRDPDGRICCSAGNTAAVFRIRHRGRIRSLRCYLRPVRHLREIYGDRLLEKELWVYLTPDQGAWTDVVVGDWIEGVPLHEAIAEAAAARDEARLTALSVAFDRLAAALVADQQAHGDLKPENIIVAPDGALHPIDFDASFLPAFAGERSPELGTAAYQHPARTAADFDPSLDDYPAALIATALHALRLDPTLHDRYGDRDGLLFDPSGIAADPALREATALFETEGLAAHYRIARLLHAPALRLPGLGSLLARSARESEANAPHPATVHPPAPDCTPAETGTPAPYNAPEAPELFVRDGLWGYRDGERIVIPPLYDCGFDFSEGLAAVRLGKTWQYIDPAGRTAIRCPGCEAVKPFRDGHAVIVRDGKRLRIGRTGIEFVI
ncbi:WG repeat-containing protein [Alistipes sp.]|uniref:WG repeat-containing protein n=1 Tax=Alistipes sp. TaxID=1872444 RepID=UPI003AEFE533